LTTARRTARGRRFGGTPSQSNILRHGEILDVGGAGRSWLPGRGIKAFAPAGAAADPPKSTAAGRLRPAVTNCAYFVPNLTPDSTRVHALAPAIKSDTGEDMLAAAVPCFGA